MAKCPTSGRPANSKGLNRFLIPIQFATLIISCFLLFSCIGTKIPLGSNGTYYERISEEELIQNHRNPQRMADKLEAERQIEIKETIERDKPKPTREDYLWRPWEQQQKFKQPPNSATTINDNSPKNWLVKPQ